MKRTAIGLLSLFLCTNFAVQAEAAALYFDPVGAEILRGDTKTIAVRVDTDEGECINVISAEISYDARLQAIATSRGDSILSLWVEEPTVDEENDIIRFSGGIPGGYCGRIAGDPKLTNVVAEIVFQSPGFTVSKNANSDSATATIAFTDATKVLLHDNFGTPAALNAFDGSLILSKKLGGGINNEWQRRIEADDLPPEEFSITLNQDPVTFSGDYYISFNTTDKQTGIDHYEIIEEPIERFDLFEWGGTDVPWITARSPYVLKDQTLNSTIRVRAIDQAGNEYLATLIPEDSQRSTSIPWLMLGAGLSGLMLLLALLYVGWRWRRLRAQRQDDMVIDTE